MLSEDIDLTEFCYLMDDAQDILYAIRHQDGGVSLYIDEDWAIERGVDPKRLVTVRIPRELYAAGTVQQVREYVATYLESLEKPEETST